MTLNEAKQIISEAQAKIIREQQIGRSVYRTQQLEAAFVLLRYAAEIDDLRFEAAKAAMQGLISNPNASYEPKGSALDAVGYADALLAELDREQNTRSEAEEAKRD